MLPHLHIWFHQSHQHQTKTNTQFAATRLYLLQERWKENVVSFVEKVWSVGDDATTCASRMTDRLWLTCKTQSCGCPFFFIFLRGLDFSVFLFFRSFFFPSRWIQNINNPPPHLYEYLYKHIPGSIIYIHMYENKQRTSCAASLGHMRVWFVCAACDSDRERRDNLDGVFTLISSLRNAPPLKLTIIALL